MCLSRPGRLAANVPTSEAEKRAANEPYRQWRFPTHYAIENLSHELASVREKATELQRRGLAREALELRFAAARLSGEIERLTASLAESI